jgi:hypothetical protein
VKLACNAICPYDANQMPAASPAAAFVRPCRPPGQKEPILNHVTTTVPQSTRADCFLSRLTGRESSDQADLVMTSRARLTGGEAATCVHT